MDINEDKLRSEVHSLINGLRGLLPKRKERAPPEPSAPRMVRLRDVHAEAKRVFPQCFLGAKVTVVREVMSRVKLLQQYNYQKHRDTYNAFSQMIERELEPKESEDVVLDLSGSVVASYADTLDGGYTVRVTSKIKDIVCSETDVAVEKETESSAASLTASMKDADPNTLKFLCQAMYRALPGLCVGSEVCFAPLSYPHTPSVSFSARYTRSSYVVSSTIGKNGFQVCCCKEFAPDLKLATIVNEGRRGGPATVGLALQKTYGAGSELKLFVDSERCGGFTYQKDLCFHEPHSEVRVLRMLVSTMLDRQRRVLFGFGFNLDF